MEVILIPGLPNDVALQCLSRLPFSQIHRLRYVCKAWNSKIKLSEVFRIRRSDANFKPQPLIIIHPLYYGKDYDGEKPRCLVVFDPETGLTSDMPPLPDSYELPVHCRTAVVGSKLVVMGGYDDGTETCLDSVFIFDFYSSTWHCGANIPDGPRQEFACVTYDNRTMFVAGGRRNRENTLISAWTYDEASNNWDQLPDMIKDANMENQSYRCTGLSYHDKFEVFIIMPGQMNRKIETFDIATRQWSETRDPFFDCDWHCLIVEGSDKNYYKIGYDGRIYEHTIDNKGRFVATLPDNNINKSLSFMEQYEASLEVENQLVASPGHIWLIRRDRDEEPYDSFKMDLNDRNWIKGKVSIKFRGHIDAVYSLII